MTGAPNVVSGASLGEPHRSRSRTSQQEAHGVGQSDGAHDVSILMAAVAIVGRCYGWEPGAKVSRSASYRAGRHRLHPARSALPRERVRSLAHFVHDAGTARTPGYGGKPSVARDQAAAGSNPQVAALGSSLEQD